MGRTSPERDYHKTHSWALLPTDGILSHLRSTIRHAFKAPMEEPSAPIAFCRSVMTGKDATHGRSMGRRHEHRAHRGHFADDVPGDGKALREGAGCHKRSSHLKLQLARHVPEGLQLLRVLADTLKVLIREVVLRVHQPEHTLQQTCPEVVEHLL